MASLTELPNEVLHNILIYAIEPALTVDLHDDPFHRVSAAKKALPALELVNRRLNEIAKPLRHRYWADTDAIGLASTADYFNLAVRLLRNPDLRSRLRHLEFHTFMLKEQQAEEEPNDRPAQDDLEDLAHEVENLHLPGPDGILQQDWANDFRAGTLDSCPALVVEWAKNLTSLAITIPFFEPERHNEFTLLRWLSNRTYTPTPGSLVPTNSNLPLANLRSVYLRWWDTESFFPHEYAAPFFALPNLRVLHASRIGCVDRHDGLIGDFDDEETEGDGPQSIESGGSVPNDVIRQRYRTDFSVMSNIEELHLVDADLSPHALNDLISHCRRLKTLKVVWSDGIENDMLSMYVWGHLLKLHANSLEEVELDFSEFVLDWVEEPLQDDVATSLGESLAQLRCLRKLNIEHARFVFCGIPETIDVEYLPATLESLTITDKVRIANWGLYLPSLDDIIQGGPAKMLAECKPGGKLPKLRTLDLSAMIFDDSNLDSIITLKSAAQEQGVELKLKPMAEGTGLPGAGT